MDATAMKATMGKRMRFPLMPTSMSMTLAIWKMIHPMRGRVRSEGMRRSKTYGLTADEPQDEHGTAEECHQGDGCYREDQEVLCRLNEQSSPCDELGK